MRAFIAIDLPKDLKNKLHSFQNELKKLDIIEGNWTKEYHLTLKFLGDITEDKLKEIEKVLAAIADKTKKFELNLQGISGFPSTDYVRVMWLGVGAGDEEALVLHEEIDDSLAKSGFEKEKRYENHITLCRVKKVSDKGKLKEIFKAKTEFGKFEVSEIKLIKSYLTKKGQVYDVLKTFNFS